MKILLILNYSESIGGISGQVENLLEGINKTTSYSSSIFNCKNNNLIRLLLPFKLLFVGRKYDVFHIHGCSWFGFYPIVIGVLIGNILNKRIIVTYHGGGIKEFIIKYKTFVKLILNKSDIITAPSPYVKNTLTEHSLKTIYLPNIIRTDNVKFKKRNKIELNFIVTRSFEALYNIPLAIKAFAVIQKKYPYSSLRFVGGGSLENEMKKLVASLKLENVHFIGRVPNSQIGKELNKADIFINPTTEDNMPLSLFEAFACGLIVISTNVGGLPDFVKDRYNGMLIESNNVDQMVGAIEYVYENQEKAKRMIKKAYEYYQEFSPSLLMPKYLELYTGNK